MVLLPIGLAGCWNPPAPTVQQLDRGLVIMFPGIEGSPWLLEHAHRALRDGGVEAAVRVCDWRRPRNDPLRSLKNLTEHEDNRELAQNLASQITQYRALHKGGNVDLVGYSGGAGLAVMVAEALPEHVRIRNVILAHPAISPRYDLTRALERVEGKLVNFYSTLDWVILGLGTSVFGTMDRARIGSAGLHGFEAEAAVPDPELRERLEQCAWNTGMLGTGHYGGHYGMLSYEWNRRFVAPLLCGRGTEAAEIGPITRSPD